LPASILQNFLKKKKKKKKEFDFCLSTLQALALPVTDDGKKAWQSVRTRKARYAIWEIKDGAIHLYVKFDADFP
jgi:hypothetical protein